MKENVCCFTGHRSLPPEDVLQIKLNLRETLLSLIDKGVHSFVAGGAVGFDMLASFCVLDLKRLHPEIRLIIAIPFAGWNRLFSESDKIKTADLLRQTDEIITVSSVGGNGAYYARNRYMADHSGYCISYVTKRSGGSFYTVNYAKSKGVKVIPIIPDDPTLFSLFE